MSEITLKKPTEYDDIYDMFLSIIDDYNLDEVARVSEDNLRMILFGHLKFAIADFKNCIKDLENRDDDKMTFNIALNTLEQSILAKLMVKYWLKKLIQNVTQMQNNLSDRDFKTFSHAQNLRAKQDYFNIIREEVDQDMNDYGHKNFNWLDM